MSGARENYWNSRIIALAWTMDRDNQDRVLGVLKFGVRSHIEQFAEGLLYMNTLDYFAKLESDTLRTDSHEGTSHLLRGDGGILQIKFGDQFVPVAEIKGSMRYQPDALKSVNVFCMYALRESAVHTLVDCKNGGFGDTFAILTDFDEFAKRVKSAARSKQGQELQYGLVEYIDDASHLGPVGLFKKDLAFSYQSELRIALFPGTGTLLEFQVGDLSDIVMLGQLSGLNERLKTVVNEDGRPRLLIRN